MFFDYVSLFTELFFVDLNAVSMGSAKVVDLLGIFSVEFLSEEFDFFLFFEDYLVGVVSFFGEFLVEFFDIEFVGGFHCDYASHMLFIFLFPDICFCSFLLKEFGQLIIFT